MICIDPGAAGGIVTTTPTSLAAWSMPTTDGEILNLLDPIPRPMGWCADVAYLEDLVKYAGTNMPSSRMAVYAGNWGTIKGILLTCRYRLVLVQPKVWQKALGLGTASGMTKTEWKNKLKQRAEQLFPNLKVTLATADALLIYEAARRGLLG